MQLHTNSRFAISSPMLFFHALLEYISKQNNKTDISHTCLLTSTLYTFYFLLHSTVYAVFFILDLSADKYGLKPLC